MNQYALQTALDNKNVCSSILGAGGGSVQNSSQFFNNIDIIIPFSPNISSFKIQPRYINAVELMDIL